MSTFEVLKSELDLFKSIKFQNSFEKSESVEYRPTSSISAGSTIDFEINIGSDEYLDPQNVFIEVVGKLVKSDGTDYGAAEDKKYSLINYGVNTIFDQLTIYLNGTLVSQSSKTYAYLAYIEALTQSEITMVRTVLRASGFSTQYGVSTRAATTIDTIDEALFNIGKLSEDFRLYGRLHGGIFKTDRLLLNGVTMHLSLSRATNAFCTMGTAMSAAGANDQVEPVLNLSKVSIHVRKAKLTDKLLNAHANALNIGRAIYPIKYPVVKVFNLPAGQQSFIVDNVFMNQMPSKIIFGIVSDTAYNGSYYANPFAFKNYGCNHKAVHINGEMIPKSPYTPNFIRDNYSREFWDFFLHLGCMQNNYFPSIDYLDYKLQSCLTVLNLNPDFENPAAGEYISIPRQGFMNIELKFVANLTAALKLIVYGLFDNVIEIDASRNVTIDIA